MQKITTDFLIIGAGIIGLTLAYNLRKVFPEKEIVILDKEDGLGRHASGRNSGVLHAGFYYTPDSLKAKFTRIGNQELKNYCKEKNLKINECGKVVVAKNEEELERLHELYRRGLQNGVEVYLIDEKELKEIEPNAKTYQLALWSPNTATVDPLEVLSALEEDLRKMDVKFFYNTPFKKWDGEYVLSDNIKFKANKVINAAGLYADKIAKCFGFSKKYVIQPFKGLYLISRNGTPFIKRNIYPVPNLKNPFLGVHFTVTVDGKIKIGPTAIPCLWREQYNFVSKLNLVEFFQISSWNLKLFLTNQNFRQVALEEIRKYRKSYLLDEAEKLVHQFPRNEFNQWGKPGIRAQLLDVERGELVHDFVVEGDDFSLHILNAVSPALTASFPFTRYVVEKYILNKGG